MLTVFTGPMFSGKSKALMARLETKQRAHKKVLVVKPKIDNRFGAGGKIVAKKKRMGGKFEPDDSMSAYPIEDESQLRTLIAAEEPEVLGLDEAQFFGSWIGPLLIELRNSGLDIYVAGLDLDAWLKPFGLMPDILAYADVVHKFTANCFKCGQDARFTQKTGGSAEKIQVGAEEIYEARCEKCWTMPA